MAELSQVPVQSSSTEVHNLTPRVIKMGKSIQPVSTSFIDKVKFLLEWVSLNIIPLVGMIALLGLAVLGGINVFGNHFAHDQKLLMSVIFVGCFASLTFTNHKK